MESEARLVAQEIGDEREEQERWRRKTYWRVPSPISKMTPACRASGKGGNSQKKAYTPHGNGEPGNRKNEGERRNGYGNNRDEYWNIIRRK